MAFTTKNKTYGLTIPKSSRANSGKLGQSASIFQNDSSEEDESKSKTAINLELNAVAEKKKQTKQTKEEIERALKEDPSVYKYDEIYEEMEQKKIKISQGQKSEDKKPKYIANLLKSAAMRKREQERRIERTVQREREKEGDEFADKESFVTSAYRQKMLEQAEEEERLRKQDELDALHDVTKQKDLSQFYRNLLNRNIAMGAEADQIENQESKEKQKCEKSDEKSKSVQQYAPQKNTKDDEEQQRKGWSKERALNEIDARNQQRTHPGSGKRLKRNDISDNSIASESDETVDIEKGKESSPVKRSREKDKSISVKAYRNNKDKSRLGSRRVLSASSQSDESEDDNNVAFYSDRRQQKKGDRDDERRKGAKSNVGKNSEDRRRKGSPDFRKSRKDPLRKRSYSGNSSSEQEEEKADMELGRKSRISDRGGDDRKVHSNIEKRTDRRKKSEDDDERYLSREKRCTREYPDDKDASEKEKSSRYRTEKPKEDGDTDRRHKGDKERKTSTYERREDKKTESFQKERLKIYERHNDADSISSARERYLARKRAKIVPQTHEDDSDD